MIRQNEKLLSEKKCDYEDMRPEISVIMPCYNTRQELLLKCIRSVLRQTFENYELIIVDDGSNEEYRQHYIEIDNLDSRIRVIYKENGGASSARNLGVRNATGRYIIFVDSDDFLIPYFFEEAYEVISRENADVVIGGNVQLQDYKPSTDYIKLKEDDIVSLTGGHIKSLRPYMIGTTLRFQNKLIYIGRGPWTRILRRELALKIAFNEKLSICEDIVWNLQLLEESQKVCYVKRAWYIYNVHPESSVRKYNSDVVEVAEKGLKCISEYLDFTSDREYQAFCDRCFEDMIRIYNSAIDSNRKVLANIAHRLYIGTLWNKVAEKRYWKLSNIKTRLKIISFRVRVLFRIVRIKKYLKNLFKN